MAQLTLDGIDVGYGKANPLVVQDLSLTVPDGTFMAMVGPSGSGKTSILRAIGGFVTPRAGRILLDSAEITRTKPAARRLGIVFQDYALFPHMTVRANVAFGLRMRHVSRTVTARRVDEVLTLVGLTGFDDRYPDQLSGGQQQRVALARALITEPAVLLLDEPLSALDRKIRLEMQLELRRIQRATGVTAVIVTHDQQEALALGDELVVLRDGAIQQVGPPHDVYNRPVTEFVASFIGNVNLFSAVAVDTTAGRVRIGSVVCDGLTMPSGISAGDAVRIGVRPERLRLVPPGYDAAADARAEPGLGAAGTTTAIFLNGQTADCELETDIGHVLVSLLSPAAADVRVGVTYHVRAQPGDVHVFAASTA